MNLLDQRIRTFASQGLSPYEIEEKLGLQHYTIHIKYHQALMNGYATAPASGQARTLSAEEKAAPQRTVREFLAAIQIVDEQRNRDGSRGVNEISPTARAVLNQRTYRRPGYANIQETQTTD
jgi:hypothetical protein|nr:MAG TPA: hypothetical protein [Caudoviricetes sp.]